LTLACHNLVACFFQPEVYQSLVGIPNFNMNIHPLFVHFPIALLTVYGVFELLRFKKLQAQSWWFYVKVIFVTIGFLGAIVALQTGELIEDQFERGSLGPLMETHAFFATATTVVFGVLVGLYMVTWIRQLKARPTWFGKQGIRQLWQLVQTVQGIFYRPWILVLLALCGLVLITITGALGGALVYGSDIDPVVSVIYHLFF
jgi:uncharacterized membrane protein